MVGIQSGGGCTRSGGYIRVLLTEAVVLTVGVLLTVRVSQCTCGDCCARVNGQILSSMCTRDGVCIWVWWLVRYLGQGQRW